MTEFAFIEKNFWRDVRSAFAAKRSWKFGVLFVFVLSFASRGQSIFGNFSVDDAQLFNNFASDTNIQNIQATRFLQTIIAFLLDDLGVALTAVGWALWPSVLILSSIALLLILRILGFDRNLYSLLILSVAATHPYLAEIFTFQATATSSFVALASLVAALCAQIKLKHFWLRTIVVFWFLVFAFSTYQLHINTLLIVLVFVLVIGVIRGDAPKEYRRDFYSLAIATVSSVVVVYSLGVLLQSVFGLGSTSRGTLIEIGEVPNRIGQIIALNQNILFGMDEPVFGGIPKFLFGFLLLLSLCIVGWKLFHQLTGYKDLGQRVWGVVSLFGLITLFLFLPGVITVLGDWWPVPRVLSHVSLFASLLILAASISYPIRNRILSFVGLGLISIISLGGILASNQIFADQASINRYDRNLASSLVSRLENTVGFNPEFELAIVGRFYSYPASVKTMQGDLNISAFMTAPHDLLSFVSGQTFIAASESSQSKAAILCESRGVFPAASSVFVDQEIAVICLSK